MLDATCVSFIYLQGNKACKVRKKVVTKDGILTHYNVNNQGAQLQLFALFSELKARGINPKVITFTKSYEFADKDADKRNNISIRSIPYILKNYLLKRGIGSCWHNFIKYQKHKTFLSKHLELCTPAEKYDTVFVGSDEVFSVVEGYNGIMFGEGINAERMIAYAPSFGQTDIRLIEERGYAEKIAEGLQKYTSLSARDKKTKEMIYELCGRTADLVIDPVLLHKFDLESVKIRTPKKKYLVVYSYDRNMNKPEEIEKIKSFAKRNGLLTVSAGTYHKWCDKNIPCNCLEWLYIFANSSFVITDTFHGTIASVITNKPVAILTRPNINSNKLENLIDTLGITSRKLNPNFENLENLYTEEMDYQHINDRVESLREASATYLDNSLKKRTKGTV